MVLPLSVFAASFVADQSLQILGREPVIHGWHAWLMEGLKCHRQQFQGASSWLQGIGQWIPTLKRFLAGKVTFWAAFLYIVLSFCFFFGSLKGGKIQTSFKPQTGPRVMPCRFAGRCIELLTDLQPTQLVYRLLRGFVKARYMSHFLSLEIALFGWPTTLLEVSHISQFLRGPGICLCQGKDPAIGAYATTDVVGRPGNQGLLGKCRHGGVTAFGVVVMNEATDMFVRIFLSTLQEQKAFWSW